jgi:hypothetical protein
LISEFFRLLVVISSSVGPSSLMVIEHEQFGQDTVLAVGLSLASSIY